MLTATSNMDSLDNSLLTVQSLPDCYSFAFFQNKKSCERSCDGKILNYLYDDDGDVVVVY